MLVNSFGTKMLLKLNMATLMHARWQSKSEYKPILLTNLTIAKIKK